MTDRKRYAFGDCVLDVAERHLSRAGQRVPLAPKAYDLLVALVRQAGRLVTKRDLLDLLWPDTSVEEGILAVHVSALRKGLGDTNRSPRYIETVSRSGYRFIAIVSGADLAPWAAPRWPPRRPEVYEQVGHGRMHLLTASRSEMLKAETAFQAAIELDPTYAEAHAGLALTYCAQAELRVLPASDAYEKARAAALRALALDDACADAQVALGTVLFMSEWNWTGAERSFKRALEINPHHMEANQLCGRLLEALGQLEAGLEMKFRALEHDPLSPLIHLQIAISYWHQRRYDDMITWANKTLAIDSRHLLAREFLAGAYWAMGDFDRHMAENITHAENYGVPAAALEPLKHAYAAGGRAAVVQHALQQARATQHGAPDAQLALLHGEAGDMDAAFRHLDLAVSAHDPCLVHLAVAPQWDHLRGDPRFTACLVRMGLSAPTHTLTF